ncbi:MAG: helix-turn-helix domain-containing protein [Clostridia bacterium]
MDDKKMTIGEKIYELRKQKGISQEQFGDDLNVTRQTVSRWESDVNIPEMEKINEIARYFSTSTSYLLDVEQDTLDKVANLEETQKMVNSYVAAVNETSKKNSEKQIKTVMQFAVAMVAVLAILIYFAVSLNNKFNNLNHQYNNLQNEISSLQNQIYNINRPTQTVESELFSKASVNIGEYDFDANTVDLVANISLKAFKDNTKLTLSIAFDDKKIKKEFSLENGSLVNGIIKLPINDYYEITATVSNDDGSKNEILPPVKYAEENSKISFENIGLYKYQRYAEKNKSEYDKTGKYPIPTKSYQFSLRFPKPNDALLTAKEIKVSMYVNDKFVEYGTLFDLKDYDFGASKPDMALPSSPPKYDKNYEVKYYVADLAPREIAWDDTVTLYVEILDSASRSYKYVMGVYKLGEQNGSLTFSRERK